MEVDKIKKFLQSYLDSVIVPKMNKELASEENNEPIKMEVFQVLKGSYQPPIYHAFIDLEPNWESYRKKIENDVSDFMKILSITNRLKIHWNKRPVFKNSDFYGMQNKK
jgi:hypothetical protein